MGWTQIKKKNNSTKNFLDADLRMKIILEGDLGGKTILEGDDESGLNPTYDQDKQELRSVCTHIVMKVITWMT